MNDAIIKLLEIGISIIIPIIIIIMGISINKKIDKYRSNLDIEKEWKVKWADAFFDVASKYNNIVTDCVMEVHKIKKIMQTNNLNNDEELKKCEVSLFSRNRKINRFYR